jgi:hypothetical protein
MRHDNFSIVYRRTPDGDKSLYDKTDNFESARVSDGSKYSLTITH